MKNLGVYSRSLSGPSDSGKGVLWRAGLSLKQRAMKRVRSDQLAASVLNRETWAPGACFRPNSGPKTFSPLAHTGQGAKYLCLLAS